MHRSIETFSYVMQIALPAPPPSCCGPSILVAQSNIWFSLCGVDGLGSTPSQCCQCFQAVEHHRNSVNTERKTKDSFTSCVAYIHHPWYSWQAMEPRSYLLGAVEDKRLFFKTLSWHKDVNRKCCNDVRYLKLLAIRL